MKEYIQIIRFIDKLIIGKIVNNQIDINEYTLIKYIYFN